VAIVGIPKIGKSSLMHNALAAKKEKLWNEHRFLVVWYTLKKPSENI
jgi:ribosome biogenesis GTPase A